METRVCSKCGAEKPISDFDYGMKRCKVCIKQVVNEQPKTELPQPEPIQTRKCLDCGEDKILVNFRYNHKKCTVCEGKSKEKRKAEVNRYFNKQQAIKENEIPEMKFETELEINISDQSGFVPRPIRTSDIENATAFYQQAIDKHIIDGELVLRISNWTTSGTIGIIDRNTILHFFDETERSFHYQLKIGMIVNEKLFLIAFFKERNKYNKAIWEKKCEIKLAKQVEEEARQKKEAEVEMARLEAEQLVGKESAAQLKELQQLWDNTHPNPEPEHQSETEPDHTNGICLASDEIRIFEKYIYTIADEMINEIYLSNRDINKVMWKSIFAKILIRKLKPLLVNPPKVQLASIEQKPVDKIPLIEIPISDWLKPKESYLDPTMKQITDSLMKFVMEAQEIMKEIQTQNFEISDKKIHERIEENISRLLTPILELINSGALSQEMIETINTILNPMLILIESKYHLGLVGINKQPSLGEIIKWLHQSPTERINAIWNRDKAIDEIRGKEMPHSFKKQIDEYTQENYKGLDFLEAILKAQLENNVQTAKLVNLIQEWRDIEGRKIGHETKMCHKLDDIEKILITIKDNGKGSTT